MKNRKNLDLLTEVNLMRNMMGLNPKTLITESAIPVPLLKALLKTTVKYVGKTSDEIITAFGAKAKNLNDTFDNLSLAITKKDSALIKQNLNLIVNKLNPTALNKITNDILSDATDGLTTYFNNSVKNLANGGLTDDAIKQGVNDNIDIILADVPDKLKNTLKIALTKTTDTTLTTIRNTEAVAKQSADLAKQTLDQNTKIKDQMNLTLQKLKADPSYKALNLTEKSDIIKIFKGDAKINEKTLDQLLNEVKAMAADWLSNPNRPDPLKTRIFNFLFGTTPRMLFTGTASIIALLLIAMVLTGRWDLAAILYKKNEEGLKKAAKIIDDEGENTTTAVCDKEIEDFIEWAESEGIVGGDPTFDKSSCTGTVWGDPYTWDGTKWK